MGEFNRLHPTVTGAQHPVITTKKHELIKDLERNVKRLTERKNNLRLNVHKYATEHRATVCDLVDYINGKDETQEKKRKHQEEQATKKKAREDKQLAKSRER